MRKKAEIAITISILLFLAGVLIIVSLLGSGGRKYLDHTDMEVISEPSGAVAVWTEDGVRGRVLVHFDRHIRAGEGGELTNENYVYQATVMNIVRKIYHIIPDNSWPEVSDTLSKRDEVSKEGETFRLTLEGAPIIITRIDNIPFIEEKVLVDINCDYWSGDDLGRVKSLLEDGLLTADVITVSGLERESVVLEFQEAR